jgi:hypothetical protein
MSNAIENVVVPSYMMQDAARAAALLAEAAAGIGGNMPPTLGLKGTRFVFKESGKDDEIFDGLKLPVVILRGKAAMEKKWYATKYKEGQEPQTPDCFSLDGAKPDPSAKSKQCDSCAGCAKNVFGTGTDAAGNPGKGKACTDVKVLAVFVNKKGIFRFPVPPASFSAFGNHCKQLGGRGIPLQGAITVLGFDATASFPKVTFDFAQLVPEAQYHKLVEMSESEESLTIIGKGLVALPAPPAASGSIEHREENKVAEIDEAREKKQKEEADKAAKAEADKKAKAEKAAADKKAKEAAAAKKKADEAAAAAASGSDDLGLDLGGDASTAGDDLGLDLGGDPATALGAASVDDVVDALGLDLGGE